ncbi:MAG: carboxy terminal-processing peptidase [Pseudomonadota bacterium]|jgi:carboxyl-terminal processing protease
MIPIRTLLLALALGAGNAPVVARPGTPVDPALLAPTSEQAQSAMWATRFLTRFHYKRTPLDDTLSAQIHDRYLDGLDGDRLFFLQSDVDRFAAWRTRLDDAIYDGDLGAPFDVFRTYIRRVGERTAHARGLLAAGFDFTLDESIDLDRDDVGWAKTTAELDDLWRKRVKNDWLRLRLNGKADAEIRKTLDRRYKSFGDRVRELDGEDVFQTFMNAYASAIEPHTGYLGPRTAENFTIQMRLSLEGIGAVLMKQDEYTTVRSVVKGGPAGRLGSVGIGDRIVGVGQGEKGPMQDVIGWRVDDVVDLIRGPKGTTVALDLIPGDAPEDSKPVRVTIVRDTVQLEEQAAKKSVIDAGGRRIGVIHLPTFYHDFEGNRRGDADARSSTRDVRRLIGELRRDGVSGMVIDLRQNGGGSLTEATNLTGLFVDRGPVVQVRDAQGKVSVESDEDTAVAWDGPLAVLVDRSSASASEIFAAALQDYGRALIIGQTTYGKGTVQNLIDLDTFANNDKPIFGQVKLTVAQFFRVNGGSTQNRGVVPDIEWAGPIDPALWGESAIDNALPWASITPADYRGRGDFRELVPLLVARHQQRVAGDREFQYYLEDLEEGRRAREQKALSLSEAVRRAERDRQQKRIAQRKAERGTLAEAQGKAAADADERLDDGLQADERRAGEDEDDTERRGPDAPLDEAARVLADAIELLSADTRLASKVKAFEIADAPRTLN